MAQAVQRCMIPGMQDWRGSGRNARLTDDEIVGMLIETETESVATVSERHGVSYQALRQWRTGENRRNAWSRWQQIKAAKRGERF